MSKKNGKWVVAALLLGVAILSLISVMIQSRIDRKRAEEKATNEMVAE